MMESFGCDNVSNCIRFRANHKTASSYGNVCILVDYFLAHLVKPYAPVFKRPALLKARQRT